VNDIKVMEKGTYRARAMVAQCPGHGITGGAETS